MDISSRMLLFLEVSERGSFAKVAEHRKIDRSVVSKQVAKLEQELGVRLMNRTTRSFSITGAGHDVLRKAQTLKSLLDDTTRVAQNYHQTPRGTLKITCSYALAKQVLMPVITSFQQRFPQVKVELFTGDRVVDIVADGFDLAIRVGEQKDSSMVARYLARNRLLLLAAPSFIERFGEPKTLEELASLPAACYAGEQIKPDYIDYADEHNQIQRLHLNWQFACNEVELMRDHVLSGTSFYLAPSFHMHDDITSGRLVPIMTDLKLLDFAAIYAVYPHRDLPLRARLFFDALKEYVGDKIPIWEQNIPDFEKMYGNPTREDWNGQT